MAMHRRADTRSTPINIRRIVRDNHSQILALFHLYSGSPPDSRRAIVDEILHELASHLELEELLFREIKRWGAQGQKLVDDTELQHEHVKNMVLRLQQFEGDDDQAIDDFFEDMMQSVTTLFMNEERDLLPLVDHSLDV
jgi:hypothetical protein